MASLRQSSRTPSRASSLSRDPDADRAAAGARRPRRGSLFDDDDNFSSLSKPFKKYSTDNSDFQPIGTSNIRDKINQIKSDFETTPSWAPKKNFQTSEVSWKKETNSRGEPILKKEELTYTLPETGRNFRRSSITESSSYDSKPHVSFSTRRSSIGSGLDEDFSTSRSSVRTRKYSEESNSSGFGLPPRPSRHISVEEPRFSSAQSMRDARKLKNSDELTDNIQKMVTKMRNHHLDDADADIRSISRTVRAASLDPFEDDSPRSRSRQRARLNQFTYGIGKR